MLSWLVFVQGMLCGFAYSDYLSEGIPVVVGECVMHHDCCSVAYSKATVSMDSAHLLVVVRTSKD